MYSTRTCTFAVRERLACAAAAPCCAAPLPSGHTRRHALLRLGRLPGHAVADDAQPEHERAHDGRGQHAQLRMQVGRGGLGGLVRGVGGGARRAGSTPGAQRSSKGGVQGRQARSAPRRTSRGIPTPSGALRRVQRGRPELSLLGGIAGRASRMQPTNSCSPANSCTGAPRLTGQVVKVGAVHSRDEGLRGSAGAAGCVGRAPGAPPTTHMQAASSSMRGERRRAGERGCCCCPRAPHQGEEDGGHDAQHRHRLAVGVVDQVEQQVLQRQG